ncbi:MAG: TIGR03618 family F420-dependent PPOX class oxidoreductase [Proteobacteria bacterium]|nr:TIGR03618 family F420-dependent PPOX class oxidoreductase [Pseudomonadota bacterium]
MAYPASTMTQAQIEEFHRVPRNAIVGTNRRDGAPQMSPVWYLYEDGRFYIGVRVASAKYRNLQRDPRIGLCIDGGHPDSRAIMIYGRAELIEADSPWRDQMQWRITRRYYDSDEEARRFREEARERGPSALIVVTPEKTISQDFN